MIGYAPIGNPYFQLNFDITTNQFTTVPVSLDGRGANFIGASIGAAGFGFLSIANDPSGNLFLSGVIQNGNLLTTPGALQPHSGGGQLQGFLTELDPSGSFILYSTYLGGSSNDFASGLAVDSFGNAYLTGQTTSTDFPTTNGVFQPNFGGGAGNAFVARIVTSPKLSPTSSATPTVTPSASSTAPPSATSTSTATAPRTPLPTRTIQPASTGPMMTPTPTSSPSHTPAPTATMTAPVAPTITATPTPTGTPTPVGPVIYSRAALRFPTKRVGAITVEKFVRVKNPRKNQASISITAVALQSQATSGFSIVSRRTTCVAGLSIAAGESCRVAVIFAPIASGPTSDALVVTGTMTNSGAQIPITGAGR